MQHVEGLKQPSIMRQVIPLFMALALAGSPSVGLCKDDISLPRSVQSLSQQSAPTRRFPVDRPIWYETEQGDRLLLYAWPGRHIAFLTPDPQLDPKVMRRLLTVFDEVYEFYAKETGRLPEKLKTFRNLGTIAVVKTACGAGCSYLGSTGVELLESTFEMLYAGVRDRDMFDQALFYEFGRNFWFYSKQMEYKGADDHGVVTTGYAVWMRFLAMDATGVKPGPFHDIDFQIFRSTVESLVDEYEAEPALNWGNTLKVDKAPSNSLGLGATDLFASFMMRLTTAFGPHFPARLWRAVGARPGAATSEEAVDNLVLAASAAARANLTDVFGDRWRWPISDRTRLKARKKFGEPILLPPR